MVRLIAAHPEAVTGLLSLLGLAVLYMGAWIFRRVVAKPVVTPDQCEKNQATCRQELAKELGAGDSIFANHTTSITNIERDMSAIKEATMAIVLIQIPMCQALGVEGADCDELHRVALGLTK